MIILGKYILGKAGSSGLFNESVGDTLVITESFTNNFVDGSFSDNLSFTETFVGLNTLYILNDTLTLAETRVGGVVHAISVTDNLVFSEINLPLRQLDIASVRDDLHFAEGEETQHKDVHRLEYFAFTERFVAGNIYRLSVNDTLSLGETTKTNFESTKDSLVIHETIVVTGTWHTVNIDSAIDLGPFVLDDDNFKLVETFDAVILRTLNVTDNLVFKESHSLGPNGTFTDTLSFTETLDTIDGDKLSITETFSGTTATGITELVTINESFIAFGTQVESVVDELSLTEGFVNYVVGPTHCDPVTYSSFIIQFPYTSPTTTITLRSPNFGDTDTLQFERVQRVTRGGTFKVARRSGWPQSRTQQFAWTGLKESEVNSVLTLFDSCVGADVKITDIFGNVFKGIISQPQVVKSVRGYWDLSFTFEGDKQ